VLRRLEDTGRVRRGYFVAGLGGAQFAEPGALDRLRGERDPAASRGPSRSRPPIPPTRMGAVDWPAWNGSATCAPAAWRRARVLVDGHATAWIARGDRQPSWRCRLRNRSRPARASARPQLVCLAETSLADRRGWLIAEVNGEPAVASPVTAAFVEAGFDITSGGLQLRVARRTTPAAVDDPALHDDEAADA
jgi:ATP-dependent Lhr-like helicase